MIESHTLILQKNFFDSNISIIPDTCSIVEKFKVLWYDIHIDV